MAKRIVSLDALRFLCALCVVQGHLRLGGYLIMDRLDGPRDVVHAVRVAFSQGVPIPTGPNAVIVFFVISGFCIHFPYRNDRRMNFREFILRRYVRVGVPAVIAAICLYRTGFTSLQDSVLWSVICEMIYYTIYPLLIRLKDRFGWRAVLAGSFALAMCVVVGNRGSTYNGNFTAFGTGYTWILGLPCWLLGCILAENHARFRPHDRTVQWLLRCGIILAASAATTARFYAEVGYYWTQPLLAILVYYWLGTEIAYHVLRRPWRWLEWCGSWSYSIYLFHAPISLYVGNHVVHDVGINERLLVESGALLVGSYLLYRLVERPAHLLARRYVVPAKGCA